MSFRVDVPSVVCSCSRYRPLLNGVTSITAILLVMSASTFVRVPFTEYTLRLVILAPAVIVAVEAAGLGYILAVISACGV